MTASDEQVNQCEHFYLPEESSHEYLTTSCSAERVRPVAITAEAVTEIDFGGLGRANETDCPSDDVDNDRPRCLMRTNASDDENVDAIESQTVIEIVICDDGSVMVIVKADATTMKSMTTMNPTTMCVGFRVRCQCWHRLVVVVDGGRTKTKLVTSVPDVVPS
jgi:hypothetical protein